MNFLIISTESPELSIGGIERHIKNLLTFCPNLNQHRFTFILPKSHKPAQEVNHNITIHRCPFLLFKPKRVFGKKIISQQQIEAKSQQLYHFLNQICSKQKFDFCISQAGEGLPPRFSFSLHLACLNHNIPLILRVHSFPKNKLVQAMINGLPWFKILPVSQSVSGDLYSKKIDISRLKTKYLGVNKDIFNARLSKTWLKKSLNLPPDSKIILHASRITDGKKSILKEKGIITLLKAFAKIQQNYPNLYLVIATATPPNHFFPEFNASFQELIGYTDLHNIKNRVITKKFPLSRIAKAYAGSDLFVLASQNETFGQVYLEAMACGTPVIGTNVGGIPEIIKNDHNGFLIPPDNSSLLSQKIEQLLFDQALRKNFIKNGLKTTNHKFSAKKQLNSFFSYLEDIKSTNPQTKSALLSKPALTIQNRPTVPPSSSCHQY